MFQIATILHSITFGFLWQKICFKKVNQSDNSLIQVKPTKFRFVWSVVIFWVNCWQNMPIWQRTTCILKRVSFQAIKASSVPSSRSSNRAKATSTSVPPHPNYHNGRRLSLSETITVKVQWKIKSGIHNSNLCTIMITI